MNNNNTWMFLSNGTNQPEIVLRPGCNSTDDSVQVLLDQLASGLFGELYVKEVKDVQGDITEVVIGTTLENIDSVTESKVRLVNAYTELGLSMGAKQEDLNRAIIQFAYDISEGVKPTPITPDTTEAQLDDLENGVYRASGAGVYSFSPALQIVTGASVNTIPEGYDVRFQRNNNGWRVASAIKLPTINTNGYVAHNDSALVTGNRIWNYILSNAITKYNSTYASEVGYSNNQLVWNNGKIYKSKKNNNSDAISVTASWEEFIGGSGGDLSAYALRTWVTEQILEAQLGGDEVDLSSYAKKDASGLTSENVNAWKSALGVGDSNKTEIPVALSALNTNLIIGDVNGFIARKKFKILEFQITAYPTPLGATLSVGIKKNGSLVTTTHATIASGTNNSTQTAQPVFDSDVFEVGDRLNFTIISVGSTATGQNLIAWVKIEYI